MTHIDAETLAELALKDEEAFNNGFAHERHHLISDELLPYGSDSYRAGVHMAKRIRVLERAND